MSDLYWLTDEQMKRLEPYFLKGSARLLRTETGASVT